MSKLRQAMSDAMLVRGFAVRTQRSYLSAVEGLAKYYDERSPVRLSTTEIQAYFLYPVKERHLAPASCRLSLNGIQFLYKEVLQRAFEAKIQIPKRPQRIPELLTPKEVAAILAACSNRKHRMLLTVGYGCGLRVGELVHLQVRDIDGERRLLRIDQGKGAKDRMVEIPEPLLLQLRRYWQLFRPYTGLFPGREPTVALGIASAQKRFKAAKCRADVDKVGGIHGLRHAYATHRLAAGMPLAKLQQQMGHKDIHTTLRYVHCIPNYQGGDAGIDPIADLEADHEPKNRSADSDATVSARLRRDPRAEFPRERGLRPHPRLSDRGIGRYATALRSLRLRAALVLRLPRPPLSQVPVAGDRGLVQPAAPIGAAGDLLPPGVHPASRAQWLG